MSDRFNVIIEKGCKRAGLIIPIVIVGGEAHLLFEQRSGALSDQPGDICFPGGMVEEGESIEEAAIRECCEELLVSRAQLGDVKALPFLHRSNLAMFPFAAKLTDYIPDAWSFDGSKGLSGEAVKGCSFNRDEVSEVFTVPLDFFRYTEPEGYTHRWVHEKTEGFPYERIPGGENYKWRTQDETELFYEYDGRIIWGFTARIIYYGLLPELYRYFGTY